MSINDLTNAPYLNINVGSVGSSTANIINDLTVNGRIFDGFTNISSGVVSVFGLPSGEPQGATGSTGPGVSGFYGVTTTNSTTAFCNGGQGGNFNFKWYNGGTNSNVILTLNNSGSLTTSGNSILDDGSGNQTIHNNQTIQGSQTIQSNQTINGTVISYPNGTNRQPLNTLFIPSLSLQPVINGIVFNFNRLGDTVSVSWSSSATVILTQNVHYFTSGDNIPPLYVPLNNNAVVACSSVINGQAGPGQLSFGTDGTIKLYPTFSQGTNGSDNFTPGSTGFLVGSASYSIY